MRALTEDRKAILPIFSNPSGKSIFFKFEQPEKAVISTDFVFGENTTSFRLWFSLQRS